ncbi:5974_t:CDS:2 [Gigaspora margarita]|uniref:5974_t:CDS:1 n=1 Tax=Gigaspora margarita TaxID=4874 RepID=A0ABN7UPS2_GIGMA|nr:5974_t:CDS:2 [Gigaspora margarita]
MSRDDNARKVKLQMLNRVGLIEIQRVQIDKQIEEKNSKINDQVHLE